MAPTVKGVVLSTLWALCLFCGLAVGLSLHTASRAYYMHRDGPRARAWTDGRCSNQNERLMVHVPCNLIQSQPHNSSLHHAAFSVLRSDSETPVSYAAAAAGCTVQCHEWLVWGTSLLIGMQTDLMLFVCAAWTLFMICLFVCYIRCPTTLKVYHLHPLVENHKPPPPLPDLVPSSSSSSSLCSSSSSSSASFSSASLPRARPRSRVIIPTSTLLNATAAAVTTAAAATEPAT